MARPVNPATERRVYTLPANLLADVRRYQADRKIKHETEAVRRLLIEAVQAHEGVPEVLERFRRARTEKLGACTRSLGRVAMEHVNVRRVTHLDPGIEFEMRDGNVGRFEVPDA